VTTILPCPVDELANRKSDKCQGVAEEREPEFLPTETLCCPLDTENLRIRGPALGLFKCARAHTTVCVQLVRTPDVFIYMRLVSEQVYLCVCLKTA